MASIHHDSELMVNYVAAAPVAAHSSLVTLIQPRNLSPAVLGLSNDVTPTFNLIVENTGLRKIINLGSIFGLGNATVQAFHAQQDADLKVYLVFATRLNDAQSTVHVVKPFSLDNITPDRYATLVVNKVESFYIGPPTPDSPYPMILVAHKKISQMNGTSDLSRILVNGTTTQILRQFSLPQSPDTILDICAASHLDFGAGVWVLCSIQGKRVLMGEFALPDEETGIMQYRTFSPICPTGATSIESFLQKDNHTGVWVGASDGLYVLDAKSGISSKSKAILVSNHSIFTAPRKLTVAQDGEKITVWSVGQQGDLGYATTTTKDVTTLETTYALIPAFGASNFGVTISRPNAGAKSASITQTLVTVNDQGLLSLLEQSRDTGLWRAEPFHISAPEALLEIPSYSISLTAYDSKKTPVINGSVFIKSSSTISAIVNGRIDTLSSLGSWLPLDGDAELNLIVATTGLSVPSLTLAGMKTANGNNLALQSAAGFVVDASRKALTAFQDIKEDTDLRGLKMKTGKPLFTNVQGDMPSSSDLQQAAKCFSQFNKALGDFNADGTIKSSALVANISKNLVSSADLVMDGLHWLQQKYNQTKSFILEKVGQTWQFVCDFAGESKRFLLDKFEKVSEAMCWVWGKIKLGWKELQEFAGFLFDWDGILECKQTIRSLLLSSFDYGGTLLAGAEASAETFFSDLQKKISERITSGNQNAVGGDGGSYTGNPAVDASRATSVKWMYERFKNGGAATGMQLVNTDANSIGVSRTKKFETNTGPIAAAVTGAVDELSQNLTKIFNDTSSIGNEDVWRNLSSDLLAKLIDCLKVLILGRQSSPGQEGSPGLLKELMPLTEQCKKLLNYEIQIPVISGIWRMQSNKALVVLDAVALIIAVPTCLIIKAVTGSKPPDLSADATFLEKLYNGEQSDKAKADFALYASTISVVVSGILNLKDFLTIILKLDVETVPSKVQKLSSGGIMTIFRSMFRFVGVIAGMPTSNLIPGADIRRWAGYLTIAGIGSQLLFALTSLGGTQNAKIMRAINCCISLANFGLYSAVYAAELDPDVTFKEKDTMVSACGITENVFTLMRSVSVCTAVMTSDKLPEVAVVALAVMVISGTALVANKSVTMSRVWKIKGTSSRGVISQ